ncbi:hypothetical protein D9M68_735940 [compost metagenome]
MLEGIADILPAAVDVEEGFDLQHDPQAAVAGALVPAAEQPAIDLLALFVAGGDGVAEGGVGLLDQVAEQPQFQGVDAGDIALVGQVVGTGAVVQVQLGDAFVGQLLLRHMGAQEGGEGRLIDFWHQVAVHRGEAHGGVTQAAEEGVEALLRRLALVLAPEA